MEDIEDLLVGSNGGGTPPGFRLPLNSVGVKPKKKNKHTPIISDDDDKPSSKIPGTQVSLFLAAFVFSERFSFSKKKNF